MAYKLKLPIGTWLHLVFHILLLKKKIGGKVATNSELPPITNEGTITIEPEAILDKHWVRHAAKFIEESLIKLHNLALEDAA